VELVALVNLVVLEELVEIGILAAVVENLVEVQSIVGLEVLAEDHLGSLFGTAVRKIGRHCKA
jgi:hypothetical protein